jgi:pilus assembly protein FimV
MVAKRSSRALALLLVMPSAAFALGLGDIHLLSPLNAPLDATIDLDATPEELQSLKVQIAPRDVFVQHGLDWPVFLSSMQVKAERGADGREVIRLRSTDTITEPFVTLLVEVDWARGHTTREYTMLLDPPVYTPNQRQANAPVAAPAAGAGAHEGQIARPAPPAPAASQSSTAPEAASNSSATPVRTRASSTTSPSPVVNPGDSTHLVKRGETLSQIATSASGGGPSSAQTREWMLAIYQANPRAFDQNMNLLRSGAVLRMPDAAAVAAVSPTQASAEIRRQYAAWRGGAGASETAAAGEPGHLRLVSPTEPGGTATGTDTAQVKALQGRVHDLEGQLSEQKRLLEMRNAELADLQQKLAAKQGAKAPASEPTPASAPAPAPAAQPPAEAAAPPATPPAPPVAETPPPAPAPQPEAAATPPPQAPATAAPSKPAARPHKPSPPPAAAPESGGILDILTDYWWALAGVGVLILAWLGIKAMRSRRQNDFDDSLGRLAAAGAESANRGFASGDTGTQPRPSQAATPREDAFLVEESGTHERPKIPGGPAPAAAAAKHVSSDETISSETAINLDQGDPLAEADFHMAYGLYDQAADLIRIAISREPARRDLKLKLLEVFFVWGNKDQFLQTARELAETREDAAPGEWEKIVIMGKQLAPEDPLFATGGGLSGATAGGVDLNLEGGQSRVDFDLLGEPVPGEAGGDVDLDIGSALGDTAASSTLGTATDRNAAIDQNFTGAATGTTRQMTQRISREDDTSLIPDFDPEAPTVEQPAISTPDNPTIRQKLEIAMRQNPAEQTAELAIDDLGLDLGALDTMDQPGLGNSPDAPTLVAGMDDHSRRVMEDAQRRAHAEDDKPSETGTWHMDESELDAALSDRANGSSAQEAHDSSATSRLQALNARDVDYDLGDMNGATHAANGSGVDLDIGSATVPDTAFTSTQKLSSDDLALPDLEPVTMSEVGTKLDLARAYMDMGDPDGARNILEEVLSEGSSTQKQEAQRLMESLPG